MMRRLTSITAALLVLTAAGAARALYQDWGAWSPGKDIWASFWPEGARRLANRKERVAGHMLNRYDYFAFRGDPAALTAFLKDLAAVQGPRSVSLLSGEERPGITNPRFADADWSMSISGNSHVDVDVPLGLRFGLADLKIPEKVEVWASGEVGPDVRRFVSEHEKRRIAPVH